MLITKVLIHHVLDMILIVVKVHLGLLPRTLLLLFIFLDPFITIMILLCGPAPLWNSLFRHFIFGFCYSLLGSLLSWLLRWQLYRGCLYPQWHLLHNEVLDAVHLLQAVLLILAFLSCLTC